MTFRALTLALLALTLTLFAGLAAAGGDARISHDAPFPTVWLDPLDLSGADGAPGGRAGADVPFLTGAQPDLDPPEELATRLAWEPLNWRINSDITTQVHNEEQVVINALDPNNLVATWRDFRLGYRQVGIGYSFDGGYTWQDYLMEEPTYPRQSDPGLTFDRLGGIYLVVLSYSGDTSDPNGLFVLKSTDGGVTFGNAVPVVNGVPGVFEDKELIGCDRTGGPHDGNVYVTWARFFDTQIMVSRSIDGAQSFQTPLTISDQGGVQWPVPAVGSDGTAYVAWVNYNPPEIRLDRSFDGGVTWGDDITVTETDTGSTNINGGIWVFCFPAMDCDITGGTYDGRIYISYMDWWASDYDIFLRYSDDHGDTWSSPLRVNNDFVGNGRDQFHPWTYVSDDGVVNVIFYDRRHDPSNYLMDLYLAQSFDGGQSFEPNIRITTVSSDPNAGTARAGLIGEYIGLAAVSAERVHPVWTDTRLGDQDVFTAVYDTTRASVEEGSPVTELSLRPPFPNPAAAGTRIAFSAPDAAEARVRIVDVAGRVVRELRATVAPDGTAGVDWDGADATGRRVASGVYLVEVSTASARGTAKVVLLQ